MSVVGHPESSIILSQCVIYLSSSPKSNSSYKAIKKAQQLVKTTKELPIPLPLRNSPTNLMKEEEYGKNYAYAHDYEDNFSEFEYMPDKISNTKFYEPGDNSREKEIRKRLKFLWKEKYNY